MKTTETQAGNRACPDAETLAAFLAATGSLPGNLAVVGHADAMSPAERRDVAAHLVACDRCVEELRTAQRRLLMSADVAIAVPAAVAARSAAALPQKQPVAKLHAWLGSLRDRLANPLRLPVLVPAAAAIALLVLLAPRPDHWRPALREMSRSVPVRQEARVTAESAAVRAERTASATVIATVQRGARVVLLREEEGWLRVGLSDGTEGWIERQAFE